VRNAGLRRCGLQEVGPFCILEPWLIAGEKPKLIEPKNNGQKIVELLAGLD
jgi:hypothetical protein